MPKYRPENLVKPTSAFVVKQMQISETSTARSLYYTFQYAIRHVQSQRDEYGKTMRRLLSHPNFNINYVNEEYQTLLHMACCSDVMTNIGAHMLISDERCDINVQNFAGYTPLIMCVRLASSMQGYYGSIIQALLSRSTIKVNLFDNCNETALDKIAQRMAANKGSFKMKELKTIQNALVAKGASLRGYEKLLAESG